MEMEKEKKIVHLSLGHRWWTMVEKGVKKEDYRANKLIYRTLLWNPFVCGKYNIIIRFYKGRTKTTMDFEIKDIAIGKGKKEWGAPNEDVYIIYLGKRIN